MKAVRREMSSSNAVLGCVFALPKSVDDMIIFFMNVYKLDVPQKIDRRAKYVLKHIISFRFGSAQRSKKKQCKSRRREI
jgi:hypothetical protein